MLSTGTILQGRYRVAGPLGKGGMAAVYRVWDMRLNAPLALKKLTPQPGGIGPPTLVIVLSAGTGGRVALFGAPWQPGNDEGESNE